MSEARSIIVTGGASGIGRAASLLLARRGNAVTIADRDVAAGQALAAAIRDEGGRALFVPVDVREEDSVKAAVAQAVAAHGGLNGAINSAGVEQKGRWLHELDAADWDFCTGINLRGMFLCLKHQIAAMLPAGGAVVAISSAAAVKGLVGSAEYCASKAGVIGLVNSAAAEYAERGIRINALLPGGTATPLAERSSAGNPRLAGTLCIPMGRLATPDEIAAAAVWLVSDESSYVTGASLAVDGGMAIT